MVFEKDAENASCRMKIAKAASLGEIAADLIKFMAQDCIKSLTDAAKGLLEGMKMLNR